MQYGLWQPFILTPPCKTYRSSMHIGAWFYNAQSFLVQRCCLSDCIPPYRDVFPQTTWIILYTSDAAMSVQCPKVRWANCAKCQRRIVKENLEDEYALQSWFIGQFNEFLKQNGKKLIGWDEILEGGLHAGSLVMSWRVSSLTLQDWCPTATECHSIPERLDPSEGATIIQVQSMQQMLSCPCYHDHFWAGSNRSMAYGLAASR